MGAGKLIIMGGFCKPGPEFENRRLNGPFSGTFCGPRTTKNVPQEAAVSRHCFCALSL